MQSEKNKILEAVFAFPSIVLERVVGFFIGVVTEEEQLLKQGELDDDPDVL